MTYLRTVFETIGECYVDDQLFTDTYPLGQLEIDGPVDWFDGDRHRTRLADSSVPIDREESQLGIGSIGNDQVHLFRRRFAFQVCEIF